MKHFNSGFLYFTVVVILLLALSTSAVSSVTSTQASLLDSIQKQLTDIIAAVARIQARLLELVAEEVRVQEQNANNMPAEPPRDTAGEAQVLSPSAEAVWKFIPVPSLYLSQPLSILYRFSITGGTTDTTISSVTYAITLTDVSIKDLEVYAYSDEFFSVPAFLRDATTKKNRVGKKPGFFDTSANTTSILFDQGPPAVKIGAGETYYFELRGTVVAKNKNAGMRISGEGLSEIELK